MTQGIETVAGGTWWAPQASAGTIATPNATGSRWLKQTGEDGFKPAKTYGEEETVDGNVWSDQSSYVDTIGGDVGSATYEGQIETAAFLFARMFAVDSVSGSSDPYTHTITSGTNVPADNSVRVKTGASVGPVRQAWYDAKQKMLTLNNGQSQKILHLAPQLMAINAAEVFSTDPSATATTDDALNWSECVTKINDVAIDEISGDSIEIDSGIDVIRGQTAKPVCFAFGKGKINRTLSSYLTSVTLPILNNVLYGSGTPSDATAVTSAVVTAKIETLYTRSASRTLKITTPKVEIKPDDWVFGPKAEGGAREIAFGGRVKNDGTGLIQVVAKLGLATALA